MGDEGEPHRVHRYRATVRWSGSTATGYDRYERTHQIDLGVDPTTGTPTPTAPVLAVSADPAFLGDPHRTNPEQLLLAAAASCHLLSFLALAARARVDVIAYRDEATAAMPEDDPPVRITEIDLRPEATVVRDPAGRATPERLQRLHDLAHEECFIANSLRSEIRVTPTFRWV